MSSETKVSQGTKGAWGRSVILEAADRYSVMINIDGEIRPAFRMSVARPADEARYAEAEARLEADAALVAEAGTVLHETGLTPRELADKVKMLEHANKILELKNKGTLANNLCSDHRDKQIGKPCLACEIETLTRQRDQARNAILAYGKGASFDWDVLGRIDDLEQASKTLEGRLLNLCRALPTFDIDQPDAADFVDNSEKFMAAMTLAKSILEEVE